ncbi:unnamed protein product [Cuscuta campestris]|uniref:CCHC-type domain-containing protein n=1 Tax=Cuscuta campestris TaxID=132261 RepID=A0A484LWR0_9ASTE|nr:unnamed protein product [Cuscuta campestris]
MVNNMDHGLPKFSLLGYDDWKIMMEAQLYALHDCMWMVLEDGPLKIQMENPERNPATLDVVQYIPKPKEKWDDRDCKKHNLDNVAKAAIFKTLDPITFFKIKHLKTAMEIWQGLGKLCEGSEDLRKQKIEVLLEKFKSFKMLPGESFDMLDERFHKILNDLASLNHVLSPKEKNVRLLRSLPTEWYTKATAMEEGRNLENYTVQGLFDELRTYEHELKKKKEEQVTPFSTALMTTPRVPSSEGTCPRNCDTPSSSQPSSSKMENYDEEFAMMVKQFRKFKKFFKKADSVRRPSKGKPQVSDSPPESYLCYNCRKPGHWKSACPYPKVEKYGERERNEKKKKAMVAAESDESSSSSSDEEALVCMERRAEKSNHEDRWTMSEDDTLCLMAKDDADQEVTSQTSCSSSYESIPTSENLFDQFKKMMKDFEEINLKHSSLTEENKLLSEENLKLTEGRKSQLNEITQLKTENESLSEKVKSLNKELGTLKSKEAVDKLLETTKHKGREGLGKCFVLNNGKNHLNTFDEKSDEAIFLGYSMVSKAFRVFNKRTMITEESIHVIFDEKHVVDKPSKHDHEVLDLSDKDEEVNEGDRMKPTEFIPFRSLPLKTSQRNPDSDSAEPSENFGQPSNIPDLSNGDNSGNVKGKKYEARYWLYYLSSKGENRASASSTAEKSSSDNVPLIHMAKTAKRKQVVSPSISIEAPQNLALVSVEEAEEVSIQGELQRKKRKLSSPSTSEYVNSDKLKEKEPAEETSAQNRSPQQLEEEIPQVQSLPTPSPQPQMDDADNQFWQLYYDWRAWKVGNSAKQLMDWDQQLKNEKIIKKCLGIPVNHSYEEILDDYWVWQRNHEDLHLEYLANSPNSEFEVDDEDPSVYKRVFSKTTEEQVVLTSKAQAVLEATTEDFQTFPETSPAFETETSPALQEISHASEMVLTEAVQEKATSPPLEQNHKTAEEEEFQQLGQSQVFEILTTECEIPNPTEIEIPEKLVEIPEQSALQETMEQAVEAQRNSGEAKKETQMAELEVSQTPVAIFEEQNATKERDSLSRDISDFVLDEAEGESERTLKVTDEEDVQEDAESLPMQLFQRTPSSHQVTNFHFHSSSTPTLSDIVPEIWTKKVQGLIESALASQHASFRQEIEQMVAKYTKLIEKSEEKHNTDLKEISKSVHKTLEIISLLSNTMSNTMEIYASDSQLRFKEFNKVKEQIASVTVSLQKQMSLLQMDIRSALAVASANQVVTKDYLKVIIDNQKEAYKLFRLIGANSGNRKMEVILQQHSPSPIPQLPIAVKEGEASYIPSHLSMTNLILEAQQRNPENSAQHLSSSGLDGTEFIGTVVDHFSNDAQSEERRENLRRIKELCGNMKGMSEVAGSSKRKKN